MSNDSCCDGFGIPVHANLSTRTSADFGAATAIDFDSEEESSVKGTMDLQRPGRDLSYFSGGKLGVQTPLSSPTASLKRYELATNGHLLMLIVPSIRSIIIQSVPPVPG